VGSGTIEVGRNLRMKNIDLKNGIGFLFNLMKMLIVIKIKFRNESECFVKKASCFKLPAKTKHHDTSN